MALPPSHVRVEVLAGRNLQHKSKSGCNAFVTMGLSNSSKKFATATASHTSDPMWEEECRIPITGMDAKLLLTVYHRNKIGLEDFIGMLTVPLEKVMATASWAQWKDLEGKAGSREKQRGSIKIKVNFIYDSNASPPHLPASTGREGNSPNRDRRLSTKAKSVMKGFTGALHHSGRDRSPNVSRLSGGSSDLNPSPKRKLSVDDVMQDLQLEDSLEQASNGQTVIPRSATYDVGQSSATADDAAEELGSSWSRKSLKIRRHLSLSSVSAHTERNRSGVAAIEEAGESPKPGRQSPVGSGTNSPAPGSSPSLSSKPRRVNTIAQTWLSRSRSSSDSAAAVEEENIAQGNFSALSKQALVRLAARQQDELAQKYEELKNLRGYMDTVLTRVIENNPELLVNLSSSQSTTDQRDGGRMFRVSNTLDSGCNSGSPSPDRRGSDDAIHTSAHVRVMRSISSPPIPVPTSHTRTSSLISTASDSGDGQLQGSLSRVSFHGSADESHDRSHTRSASNSSSLVDSGSQTGLQGGSDHFSPLSSKAEASFQSARHRPT